MHREFAMLDADGSVLATVEYMRPKDCIQEGYKRPKRTPRKIDSLETPAQHTVHS